jgi:hypothetical protein
MRFAYRGPFLGGSLIRCHGAEVTVIHCGNSGDQSSAIFWGYPGYLSQEATFLGRGQGSAPRGNVRADRYSDTDL